jgi:hypothetical protein
METVSREKIPHIKGICVEVDIGISESVEAVHVLPPPVRGPGAGGRIQERQKLRQPLLSVTPDNVVNKPAIKGLSGQDGGVATSPNDWDAAMEPLRKPKSRADLTAGHAGDSQAEHLLFVKKRLDVIACYSVEAFIEDVYLEVRDAVRGNLVQSRRELRFPFDMRET